MKQKPPKLMLTFSKHKQPEAESPHTNENDSKVMAIINLDLEATFVWFDS